MKKHFCFFLVIILSLGILPVDAQIKCLTECDIDTLELMIPTNFGKQIEGAKGKLIYCVESKTYFTGLVQVSGLSPESNYILELYSNPNGSGSENLPEKYKLDRYWDFYPIKTDKNGNCTTNFKKKNKADYYDVKFFVKEMFGEWEVVLHNNYLSFAILE